MSFSDDDDYEEEFSDEDDDIEIWNPNDLIDLIKKTTNAETKLRLKKELLEKFLDMDRPIISLKMKAFLYEDGILEGLIGFITRLDETTQPKHDKNEDITPKQDIAVRRSYKVMELFIRPNSGLDTVMEEKTASILTSLFKIFEPSSNGNWHHFHRVMEQLLNRYPQETTKALLTEELLWKMLGFLQESPVLDTAIGVFCCGFPKETDYIQFYKSLLNYDVFGRIGERLYGKGSTVAQNVAEFFLTLIEKIVKMELSGILFIGLCKSSKFIDGLVSVLTVEEGLFSLQQQRACVSVLKGLLLKSGQKLFDDSDFVPRSLPNTLSSVQSKLHEYTKPHVSTISNSLLIAEARQTKDTPYNFSAYTIRKPFGFHRMNLMEILSDVISFSPDVLDMVSAQVWQALARWFLEFKHNNIYQYHFFKIFQVAIHVNHIQTLKTLLTGSKFLTNIIAHHQSDELSSARGFIILICNSLRLSADFMPNSWLKHYLGSHDGWRTFLPELKKITLQQQKDISPTERPGDEDIDLGSQYAASLGFESSTPILSPLVDTLSPQSSPSATRRKKKKRRSRKRSKNPLSPTSSPSMDEEDEEDEKEVKSPAQLKDEKDAQLTTEEKSWWDSLAKELEQTKS